MPHLDAIDTAVTIARLKRVKLLAQLLEIYLPATLWALIVLCFVALPSFAFLFLVMVMMAMFVIIPLGILLNIYAVATLKCWHCGRRYLPFTFLVWPFEDGCAHCAVRVSEA